MTDVRDRHHGQPFEVVIPCMTLEEANEEKADLHVTAEARAFIRRPVAGVTLTPEERLPVLRAISDYLTANPPELEALPFRDRLVDVAARLEAAQ